MAKGKYKFKGPQPNNSVVFDCACKEFVREGEDWHDAPVQCDRVTVAFGGCETCGWNPEVAKARKAKLFGETENEN